MVLGIDWGGTYLKAGLVTAQGKIVSSKVIASGSIQQKEIFIKTIQELIEGFGRKKISGVGIGAPGIIDTKEGFIYYLPNIPGWKKYPLRQELEKRVGLPFFIDNDANLVALAEAWQGAAKGVQRALFITLGTGLGGAVIINGKILEAATSACELGHVPVNVHGAECACGGRGCIETYVGNRYLVKRYNDVSSDHQAVQEVKTIYHRALQGEIPAIKVWQEFSFYLGMFLVGMVNVLNPQKIIFGGGVSGAFRLFRPMVFKVIKENAMWPQIKGLKLVNTKLKNAGVIGAARLAMLKVGARGGR